MMSLRGAPFATKQSPGNQETASPSLAVTFPLVSLRDTLLPKLVRGEVRVSAL